jgi:uncharacterized RmlC-like cupin family protein
VHDVNIARTSERRLDATLLAGQWNHTNTKTDAHCHGDPESIIYVEKGKAPRGLKMPTIRWRQKPS